MRFQAVAVRAKRLQIAGRIVAVIAVYMIHVQLAHILWNEPAAFAGVFDVRAIALAFRKHFMNRASPAVSRLLRFIFSPVTPVASQMKSATTLVLTMPFAALNTKPPLFRQGLRLDFLIDSHGLDVSHASQFVRH